MRQLRPTRGEPGTSHDTCPADGHPLKPGGSECLDGEAPHVPPVERPRNALWLRLNRGLITDDARNVVRILLLQTVAQIFAVSLQWAATLDPTGEPGAIAKDSACFMLVVFAGWMAASVAFLEWFNSYRNAFSKLGIQGMRCPLGVTLLLLWAAPIVHLIAPYFFLQECWRASTPERLLGREGHAWRKASGSWFIRIYWIVHAAGLGLLLYTGNPSLALIGALVYTVGSVLEIIVVERLAQRQEQLFQRLKQELTAAEKEKEHA
jgi:hypothetical protein